jgi:molybdopterin synthase catalytic subunit/molybdopterin converting factor small subunit
MRVNVKLFGAVREHSGAKDLPLDLPEGSCVSDLRARLAAEIEIVASFGKRLRISRNLELVTDDAPLEDGDEVALLPPVSGGGGRCTLSEHPLDPAEVSARVEGSDAGGVVVFSGAVRDRARGHQIRFLEYEAYPAMAEREMARIAAEAEARWSGVRVAMAHRVGHLEIGELAVVVAAAAPHRAEAFEACRFAIDTLKQRVPIWKKEVATDGAYWVDDHA